MTDKITTPELLLTPKNPPPKTPTMADLRRTASDPPLLSLAEFKADLQRKARLTLPIPEATLADWFERQREFQEERVRRFWFAMDKALNGDRPLGNSKDERWGPYWLLDARYRYADTTVDLLRARRHVLVCPATGVPTVTPSEWAAALSVEEAPEDLSEWYESLSLRGTLEEPRCDNAWWRYSEKVNQASIEQAAATLAENHRREAGDE